MVPQHGNEINLRNIMLTRRSLTHDAIHTKYNIGQNNLWYLLAKKSGYCIAMGKVNNWKKAQFKKYYFAPQF